MRRILWVLSASTFLLANALAQAEDGDGIAPVRLPGLRAAASITRDTNDIAHVRAHSDHDLFFLQGYLHAQDRLFQMDVSRREASGTLAELVGSGALAQDIELRTLGLRRAAERSLPLQSQRARALLQAYADGVNAWVASHPLPPEYGALGLSFFEPWSATDSLAVAKLLLFGQSFALDIDATVDLLSYRAAGKLLGFDGTKLFFEDLVRSAPFDPAATVPDAITPLASARPREHATGISAEFLQPRTLALAHEYLERTGGLAVFRRQREGRAHGSSNEWAISARLAANGAPLLANDPHLDLGTPAIWYPIHLHSNSLDAIGESFAGVPVIVVGHNRFVSWGLTDDELDVTDTFQETIVPDASSPSGLSTVYKGNNEPIIPIPEVFRVNNAGTLVTVPSGGSIPPATLVVPRRNHGPLLSLDPSAGTGISVQWTGFSGTRELEAALIWSEAQNLEEFRRGNPYFSSAPLNLAYADVHGNIAYFAIGEVPVREDLQAGSVHGLPPFFIRDGTGGNEWLPVIHLQPHQALPYEILPAVEMPHVVNPPAGFFVNSNNDPAGITLSNNPLGTVRPGGGIYYLAYTFDAGFRAGRVTQMIRKKLASGRDISFEDMQHMQADVTLLDAEFFVPYITRAFANARSSANARLAALAGMEAVQDAVARLAAWDFTTPTGIPQGYDAGDPPGTLHPRSAGEIARSVAATLYSVWRGQFVSATIDAALTPFGLPTPPDEQSLSALRNLLENFSTNNGVGASGVNFFSVPGVTNAADRRDVLILQSLASALALLSGPQFGDAFGGSADLSAYRWGTLHRITFAHILGEPFSVPTAGGAFPQPLAKLPGIPTDGGFQTVDAASHAIRAADENGFMFAHGPSKRSVFEARPNGVRGVSSLPGGISGVLGSEWYVNLLPAWLRNEAYEQLFNRDEIVDHAISEVEFAPAVP